MARDFQKRSRWRSIFQSKPFLIVFGAILLFFSWNIARLYSKVEESADNKRLSREKVTELAESKANLDADIARLKTQEGIEESIREKFGLAKEGEQLIMIVDVDESEVDEPGKGSLFEAVRAWFR